MLIKRETRRGADNIITAYRPCRIDEIFGQESNKKILKKGLDEQTLSHNFLFTGDPGCGKTTAARVLALGLNCEEGISSTPCLKCKTCVSILNQSNPDVLEINVAQSGNKGDVDLIVRGLSTAPLLSRNKIVIFDEAHELTKASQSLLLKVIEDGYSHVYFVFCTNKPEKITDPAFKGGRVSTMHFNRLTQNDLVGVLVNVAEFEGMKYDQKIIEFIASETKGVPRDALNLLKLISDEGSWSIEAAKEIAGMPLDENSPEIIELSRAMVSGKFKVAVGIYDSLKNVSAESVRIAVAGFLVYKLKSAKYVEDARKYSLALDFMTNPIYQTGKLGDHIMYNNMFKVTNIINSGGK